MPSIEGGGVEKNLFLISNFLIKKIKNITLISTTKSKIKMFDRNIKFISPKSYYWEKSNKKIKYIIALYLLFLDLLKDKNKLVLCFQANVYCTIMCKIMGVKIITRSNSSPSGWSKNFIKKILFKKILNLSDKIIVNSLDFKNELKTLLGLNSTCIFNPLNTKDIINLSKKKNINFFNKKKTLKIVNVARFTDQKDHLTLLKAVNLIKDQINFQLIIVGRGVNKYKMLDYIRFNKLSNKVKLLNFQKNPYIIMKEADLFILTSKFEGLPNVILEALTLKKGIISTDCPTGPKEILKNGKYGILFKVGDYETLSKKIIYFNENKKKIKKMSSNGKKSLYRFDYNINMNKYLKIINNLL